MAQTGKNLPAMPETWIQCLGWEDPLQKEMATHSSIPSWRIPWTEEPGGYSQSGLRELDVTEPGHIDKETGQATQPLLGC